MLTFSVFDDLTIDGLGSRRRHLGMFLKQTLLIWMVGAGGVRRVQIDTNEVNEEGRPLFCV